MKISPKADFPIQVIPETDEREGPDQHHFGGIYRAVLNHVVAVVFVPDVGGLAPPWDDRRLPSDLDPVDDPYRARLVAALLAPYVVTPNDALAGAEDRITWSPPGADTGGGVVFYVTGAEFDRFATELVELSEIAFRRWPEESASDLRRFEVVRFLERRVADSGRLRPEDAALLDRPAAVGRGPGRPG